MKCLRSFLLGETRLNSISYFPLVDELVYNVVALTEWVPALRDEWISSPG